MQAVCSFLVCLALFPAADPKAKELIVGKWEGTEGEAKGITIEFTKDGVVKAAVKVNEQTVNLEGKYKFVDDDAIEVEITFGGQTQKEKNKVKVTKDELILTDDKGKEGKFKRVK